MNGNVMADKWTSPFLIFSGIQVMKFFSITKFKKFNKKRKKQNKKHTTTIYLLQIYELCHLKLLIISHTEEYYSSTSKKKLLTPKFFKY
jgi:hypothetical protein